MKHCAVFLALLLIPRGLAAQNNVTSEQPVRVSTGNSPGNHCPIGMHASQGVWDHTIRVRQGEQEQTPASFGQRLSLSLVDTHRSPIVSATVKVRGLTGQNRMLQTDFSAREKWDGIKMMKVAFVRQQEGGVSSELYVPGFTAVRSIELIEVTYEDGAIWKRGDAGACRVAPDGIMRIANR